MTAWQVTPPERIGKELTQFFAEYPCADAYIIVCVCPQSGDHSFCSPVTERMLAAFTGLARAFGLPPAYRLKITPKVRA